MTVFSDIDGVLQEKQAGFLYIKEYSTFDNSFVHNSWKQRNGKLYIKKASDNAFRNAYGLRYV